MHAQPQVFGQPDNYFLKKNLCGITFGEYSFLHETVGLPF